MYKRFLHPWKRPWYNIGRRILEDEVSSSITDEQVSRYCKMLKLKLWVTILEELLHIYITNMDLGRKPPLQYSKGLCVFKCLWVVLLRYYRLSTSTYRSRRVIQSVTSKDFVRYMHKLVLCTFERTSVLDTACIETRDIDYTPRPGRFHFQESRKRIDAALADLPEWLLQKPLNPKVCWTCGTWSSQKYQKCAFCILARYCSPGCQRKDWRKIHRFQCPELAKLGANHALKLVKDVMTLDGSFTEKCGISKMSIEEAFRIVGKYNMLSFGVPDARFMLSYLLSHSNQKAW